MRQTDRPTGSPRMPADTKGARRLIFATAGLLALGGAGFIQQGLVGSNQGYTIPFSDTSFWVRTGVFATIGFLLVSFSAAGIILAFRFVSGGPGLRVGGIAWGILGIVAALTMWLYAGVLFIIPPLITACLVVERLAQEESGDWFRRSRN
ncbi:hypothetical protein [Streptomyces sp. GESEQ-4]|uniref:hypothetical protein n=1 Tax=Streptomyces sp. GESEQ-4 TaxID=2812655 RepID=UPI001B32C09E|nr:hypothetical protein [Streptomyces sp. GESEQ-4]